jgi:hypothetical protein
MLELQLVVMISAYFSPLFVLDPSMSEQLLGSCD